MVVDVVVMVEIVVLVAVVVSVHTDVFYIMVFFFCTHQSYRHTPSALFNFCGSCHRLLMPTIQSPSCG